MSGVKGKSGVYAKSEEHRRKISEAKMGVGNPNWKGGKRRNSRGYVLSLAPFHPNADSMGYVREHRLVIEKKIGRYLHRWEVVHHVNKIKDDNRPENLELFENHSKHRRFENG